MKVKITQSFTGYPDDTDKSMTEYEKGQEPENLPASFARLIVDKGLAEEVSAPVRPSRAPAAPKDGDAP